MTFTEAVKTCYTKKYAEFNGRASRSEFWWFFAFYALVNVVGYMIFAIATAVAAANDPYADAPVLAVIVMIALVLFDLATIVPYIAVAVRRLHDTGKAGTFYLLVLVPWVGGLIVLILCALEPNRGPNMYGPDPLDPSGQSLGLTNPYAQPYGQPAGQPYAGPTAGQPYGSAQPYSGPTANPYTAGTGQPQPYGTTAPTGQPAASPYSQPSAPQQPSDTPFATPTGQPPAAGSQPSAPQPTQDNGQQPYGFDFSKPEGYGSGNNN
ncbi:Protein of unknown function (DUF805) [Propionibacterium ruminifibrarum]|uniref:DUF805 domain-containing protein n=1 Tax=Propionibacterium ruminifibrarum TaxID=1962131 RepID=A0A375I1X2_9ACTN|nr:DUF805 domain-containing protein [Propionibacterium ruminifibrarum]SPF68802.1 Protein of unknown function (DUF805) [Propionibacterium ruminifibrarum]